MENEFFYTFEVDDILLIPMFSSSGNLNMVYKEDVVALLFKGFSFAILLDSGVKL